MNCAWKELLALLPSKWKAPMDEAGRSEGLELRLRMQKEPMLHRLHDDVKLPGFVTAEDISYVVNLACRYSPWTAETSQWGYLTSPGGHRIGLCGQVVMKEHQVMTFREYDSLNIRIARDLPGIATPLAGSSGSILIIGRPGSGKTTLLRDLLRQLSKAENVGVIDQRGELFPKGFDRGQQLDVLTGCDKAVGLDMLLRTMTPDTVAMDEITAEEDALQLVRCARCGVRLIATAHAADMTELKTRIVYQPLIREKLFSHIAVMHRDKTFHIERMTL